MTSVSRKSKIAALSLQLIITEKKLPVEHFFAFFLCPGVFTLMVTGLSKYIRKCRFFQKYRIGEKMKIQWVLGLSLLLGILNPILGILFS